MTQAALCNPTGEVQTYVLNNDEPYNPQEEETYNLEHVLRQGEDVALNCSQETEKICGELDKQIWGGEAIEDSRTDSQSTVPPEERRRRQQQQSWMDYGMTPSDTDYGMTPSDTDLEDSKLTDFALVRYKPSGGNGGDGMDPTGRRKLCYLYLCLLFGAVVGGVVAFVLVWKASDKKSSTAPIPPPRDFVLATTCMKGTFTRVMDSEEGTNFDRACEIYLQEQNVDQAGCAIQEISLVDNCRSVDPNARDRRNLQESSGMLVEQQITYPPGTMLDVASIFDAGVEEILDITQDIEDYDPLSIFANITSIIALSERITASPTANPTASPTASPISVPNPAPTSSGPNPSTPTAPQPTAPRPTRAPTKAPTPPISCNAGGPSVVVVESNGVLKAGNFVTSPSGRYKAGLSGTGRNGDLVVIDIDANNAIQWSAGVTTGHRAYMQGDGNFVLRNWDQETLFTTGTFGNPGAKLVLLDGGQLVIRKDNKSLWKSEGCTL